ncbi:MAG: hypothetical protein KKF12_03150 [Proteobacteria bacterium]|nr:hypothetical protein [Desulfobacula sp.]MBU3952294.1 hypothetical protein [Pseudomonadota bacterium]MBU4129796.1 hypothetical protein [Pseudomonadota bacterium]
MKKLLVFIHQTAGEKGKRFLSIIQDRIINATIETFHTLEAFEIKLKQKNPYFDQQILVLFVDTQVRLDQFYLKKEIFLDKKIVMVLPDKTAETISKVHRFFPRYFTFIEDGYEDICDVLNKMITH